MLIFLNVQDFVAKEETCDKTFNSYSKVDGEVKGKGKGGMVDWWWT